MCINRAVNIILKIKKKSLNVVKQTGKRIAVVENRIDMEKNLIFMLQIFLNS